MWEGDHWGGTCVPGSQVLHRWQVDPARGEQPDRWKGCIAQTHFPQGSRSFLCLDVTLVCVGSFQAQEEAGGLANTHPLGGASGQAPRSWGEASPLGISIIRARPTGSCGPPRPGGGVTRLIPFPQGVSTPPMRVGWESHGVRGSRLAHGREADSGARPMSCVTLGSNLASLCSVPSFETDACLLGKGSQ